MEFKLRFMGKAAEDELGITLFQLLLPWKSCWGLGRNRNCRGLYFQEKILCSFQLQEKHPLLSLGLLLIPISSWKRVPGRFPHQSLINILIIFISKSH